MKRRARRGLLLFVAGVAACQSAHPDDPMPSRTRAAPGPVIGHRIHADVDGDGRRDRVALRGWDGDGSGRRDALVVRTASGRRLRLDVLDLGSARHPADELLGSADVNGDGRDEVVVFTSGNTAFGAAIVTVANGRLQSARSTDLVPSFGAHGNACGACTQDATCQTWHGKPRLVETESFYLSRRGRDLTGVEMAATHDRRPLSEHRRRWQATVYDLRGAHFTKLRTLRGTEPPGAPLPTSFRFDGALSCGSAHWGLGS